MAYALDEDTEEQTGQQAASTGGSSTPTGIQAAQGQPQTGGGNTSPGNKFIGFDQYLAANQGAAQQTANKLATAGEQQGQAATGAISKALGDFRTGVAGGSGKLYSSPAPTTSAEAAALGATTYTGPKELSDVAPTGMTSQIQQAGDYSRALQSAGGREALLQQNAAKAGQSYTGGQSRLDAALVGGAKGAQSRFAQLEQQYGQSALGKYLEGAQASARRLGEQASAAVGQKAQGYKDLAKTLQGQEDAANTPAAAQGDGGEANLSRLQPDLDRFVQSYFSGGLRKLYGQNIKDKVMGYAQDFVRQQGRLPTKAELDQLHTSGGAHATWMGNRGY